MQNSINIRPASLNDAADISKLWNYYVEHSTATVGESLFDSDKIKDMLNYCAAHKHAAYCAFREDKFVGFALYKEFRTATGYRFSMEHSLYVDPDIIGGGIGARLYDKLEEHARAQGIHALIGVITAENTASIQFHQKRGFTTEGIWKETAIKFGRWLDVAFMQKILK